MYKCNLSFQQLHAYLKFLLEIGLLKSISEKAESNENLLFETTKKGQTFIKTYKNLSSLLITNSHEPHE